MDFRNNRLLNLHWRMLLYFLYCSRFRIGLLVFIELIISINSKGDWLMQGIVMSITPKTVPMLWFFIIIYSQLMVGDSSRKMVKIFFPHHIRFSLTNLIISVFLTNTFITCISGLVILLKCSPPFAIYTFFVIWTLTISFSLLSLFIKPIYLHLFSIILLICVTYLDWPKFLSYTMISRFQAAKASFNYFTLGIILLTVVIFTNIKIKNFDFYQ